MISGMEVCIVKNAKRNRYKPTINKSIMGLKSQDLYKVADKKKQLNIIARCQ